MSRVRYTAPDGNTHLEITGIYITKETVPGVQEMPNIFVRGRMGAMDGINFKAAGALVEFRIDDPIRVAAILNARVDAGGLFSVVETAVIDALIADGQIAGVKE